MASLLERIEWILHIYQLETTDPVQGGPNGIDNRQAIQLACRTQYLKQQIEILVREIAVLASTTTVGRVKLNSAVDSESETDAATPLAVKIAYDLASVALRTAGDVYSIANNANDLVNAIADRFQSHEFESRMLSHDKNSHLVVRDDGVVGLYSRLKNDFSWLINQDGWISGFIDSSRVGGLDQFVRDRATPVGVPMPWPQGQSPDGYFECNGSAFNREQYPRLAAAYPSGILPDLRGVFVRGVDNGRGLDPDRAVLSYQDDAIRNIYGELSPISETFGAAHVATGAFEYFEKHSNHTPTNIDRGLAGGVTFDASRIVPTANENRPRNVAFMYIVKAE